MTAGETGLGKNILVFFDYACVFCYTERLRLRKVAEKFDAALVPMPFELRPEMPLDGVSAVEHGLGHTENVDRYLANMARREGFALIQSDHVPHTHRAIVMAEVGRDAGRETHERVHEAILDAYFGRGLDIGDEAVLIAIAKETGLDDEAVRRAWDEGTYEDRLRDFRDFAHRLGVSATPSALVCDELLVGAQPYRRIAEAVERCLERHSQG